MAGGPGDEGGRPGPGARTRSREGVPDRPGQEPERVSGAPGVERQAAATVGQEKRCVGGDAGEVALAKLHGHEGAAPCLPHGGALAESAEKRRENHRRAEGLPGEREEHVDTVPRLLLESRRNLHEVGHEGEDRRHAREVISRGRPSHELPGKAHDGGIAGERNREVMPSVSRTQDTRHPRPEAGAHRWGAQYPQERPGASLFR